MCENPLKTCVFLIVLDCGVEKPRISIVLSVFLQKVLKNMHEIDIFGQRSICAYYNSSKIDLVHLRLLYVFQMNFAFSVQFSAYYNASKWIWALFALIFTVVFELWSKKSLVFIAKVDRAKFSA